MTGDLPFRQDPSTTAAFSAIKDALPDFAPSSRRQKPLRAVVIGGGTGAPMSIRTLLSLGLETSAVVAMADDGGSTGILREEAHVTPPGDVRKCIAAFARDPQDPLVRAFKYRFAVARNHALGNLLLTALEDVCQSFPEAIAICEDLLDARGHVYPSTLDQVTLIARTRDGAIIDGQALASHAMTALEQVRLKTEGPITAYGPALEAISKADLIVLGPGSLFTSIIPNLLVPGVVDAIRKSKGRVLFVCSIADVQGETWGLTAREHVEALLDHGMEGLIDYVLVHSRLPLRPPRPSEGVSMAVTGDSVEATLRANLLSKDDVEFAVRRVFISYRDVQAIQALGPVVIVRDLVDENQPTWHSPVALRESMADVIRLCRARGR